jgi:hypothetical protein
MLDSNAYSLSRVVGVLTLFTQFFHVDIDNVLNA